MADRQGAVGQEDVGQMMCRKKSRGDVASRVERSGRVVGRSKGIATGRHVLRSGMLDGFLKVEIGLDPMSWWSQRTVVKGVFVESIRRKGRRDGIRRSG